MTALGIISATTAASSTMGHVMPSNDSTDAQAYAIAKKAGAQAGMTEQEIQYVISVAKGEGGYGNGWGHPSAKTIQESKAFGISGSEGVGSNNIPLLTSSGPIEVWYSRTSIIDCFRHSAAHEQRPH